MIEREVKLRVPDLAPLRPLLQQMGATRAGSEEEANHILDTPDGSLRRQHQLLRLRTAGHDTLTWKGPAATDDPHGHKAREELEVRLEPHQAATALDLLSRLGYAETLRYDKRRETWHWPQVTIALDQLAFGEFVEIEGDAGAIAEALRLLHLDSQPLETRSYAELQRLHQQT